MANFKNTKKLWKYIRDIEASKIIDEELNSRYKESFLQDINRSIGELYVNGESIVSILEREQQDTQQEISPSVIADLMFAELFKKQPGKESAEDINASLAVNLFSQELAKTPTRKNVQKECFENFLRTYLHQGFIYPHIGILSILSERYLFINPEKTMNLIYTDDGLSIQVNFVAQKIIDLSSGEVSETTGDDFFIKGAATYKVNITPLDKEGWIAQFGLIESKLECKDEFKEMDTRNILEKFQEFLNAILDKLKNYFSSENSLSSSQTNHGSFFCISKDGTDVSEQILDDNAEQSSEILKIALNGMTR